MVLDLRLPNGVADTFFDPHYDYKTKVNLGGILVQEFDDKIVDSNSDTGSATQYFVPKSSTNQEEIEASLYKDLTGSGAPCEDKKSLTCGLHLNQPIVLKERELNKVQALENNVLIFRDNTFHGAPPLPNWPEELDPTDSRIMYNIFMET